MVSKNKQIRAGFTIVELLIVVVVIAILAAITIVSYNGIQNRTHDSAVQNDLRQMGIKIQEYYINNADTFPAANATGIGSLTITLSKNSYGSHYVSAGNDYNYLYCFSQTDKSYALFAASKSGNVYTYKDGTLGTRGPFAGTGSVNLCNGIGITSSDRVAFWLYGQGGTNAWATWLK